MKKRHDILISLEQRFAEKIFSGEKQVELRRRSMQVAPGTVVWIYVKLPVGSIIGRAEVESVRASTPAELWRTYGTVSGLSRQEFFSYFDGVAEGFAIVFAGVKKLKKSLTLQGIREFKKDFQPPQFFINLTADHPLLAHLPQ